MTKAAKTLSARPSATAPAACAPGDGRVKLQAFAAPGAPTSAARRANWELRALGALHFDLASAAG